MHCNRSATADDGDGTPQMPISTEDDVDDVDFDLHWGHENDAYLVGQSA